MTQETEKFQEVGEQGSRAGDNLVLFMIYGSSYLLGATTIVIIYFPSSDRKLLRTLPLCQLCHLKQLQ